MKVYKLWHDDAYTNVTQVGIQLIHRMSIFDHQIANQLQSIYLKTCPWLNNTFIFFSLQRKHSKVSHSKNFHKDELCGLAEPILFSTDWLNAWSLNLFYMDSLNEM